MNITENMYVRVYGSAFKQSLTCGYNALENKKKTEYAFKVSFLQPFPAQICDIAIALYSPFCIEFE